ASSLMALCVIERQIKYKDVREAGRGGRRIAICVRLSAGRCHHNGHGYSAKVSQTRPVRVVRFITRALPVQNTGITTVSGETWVNGEYYATASTIQPVIFDRLDEFKS